MEDHTLLVLDVDTKKIVRKFTGHKDLITDMTFSPDSKWLISSSRDSSIRVWDLSSAK